MATKRGEVEFVTTKDKSIQWHGGGIKPGTSRLQVQRPTRTGPRSSRLKSRRLFYSYPILILQKKSRSLI